MIEEIQKCKKCRKKLGFFDKISMAKSSEYCLECFKEEIKQATPEEKRRMISISLNIFPEFRSGQETVVIITKGDTQFKMAIQIAEGYNYELVDTAQSQDNWSFLETKRTLIFKKKH